MKFIYKLKGEFKVKTFKKILVILVTLSLVAFSMTGCGSEDYSDENSFEEELERELDNAEEDFEQEMDEIEREIDNEIENLEDDFEY